MIAWYENATSRLVNGAPSCHFTPLRRRYVILSPSRLIPPFSVVGTSAARIGTSRPFSSVATSGSSMNACTSASTCCVDRYGFSVFGERLVAIRNTPGCVHGCLAELDGPAVRVHPNSVAVNTIAAMARGRIIPLPVLMRTFGFLSGAAPGLDYA